MREKSKGFAAPADEVIMEGKTMTSEQRQEAQRKASERAARIREVRETTIARRTN